MSAYIQKREIIVRNVNALAWTPILRIYLIGSVSLCVLVYGYNGSLRASRSSGPCDRTLLAWGSRG